MTNHHILSVAFLFCFLIQTQAQNLKLVQGDRIRSIQPGTYLQIETPRPYERPCKGCPLNTMTGQLISVSDDSIKLRLIESNEYLTEDARGFAHKKFLPAAEGPIKFVAKTDIHSIVIKGKRKFQRTHPGDVIGIIVASLAIYDLGVDVVDDDDHEYYGYYESRKAHHLAIGALLTSGLVMLLSRQPHYITNIESDFKRKIRGVWEVY